ncbi:nuclear transport factor 2 family protein [Rhodospirillales bacterium]|nr:nuclear transport factor 2 family protein [Rhodospirillales bacterium]
MDQSKILLIKDACESVSLQFGRLQDERRHDELAELMTVDATYVRLGEELKADDFIAWVKTTPPNKTRHFVTSTVFSVIEETHAKGVTYYTLYLYGGDENTPYPLEGPFVVGEYHEEFALTEYNWKIKRREARIIFRKRK